MTASHLDVELKAFFEEGSAIYAHPVAVACGRIYRARREPELLDACLRAAEILTRYLAGIALCSLAARGEDAPIRLSLLSGNLAWGHFLQVVQEVAKTNIEHPAKLYFDAGFLPRRGKNAKPAPTNEALTSLLELRNGLGHNLNSITTGKAASIFRQEKPLHILRDGLLGVKALIEAPLFLVEEQTVEDDRFIATMLLVMGESFDPPPATFILKKALRKKRHLYVALQAQAVRLWPFLLWELVESRQNYRLFFLDALESQRAVYKSLDGDRHAGGADHSNVVQDLLEGKRREAEQLLLENGDTLAKKWSIEQEKRLAALQAVGGAIPWNALDEERVRWFVRRLDPDAQVSAREVIQERLLDGRTRIAAQEARQLVLLLGKAREVKQRLRRPILDLRARTSDSTRWDEREVVEDDNLLGALNRAVDFLYRHINNDELSINNLSETKGTPDYIAVREALVNLFIHQDYSDPSAPGQITIEPDRTILFNLGFSLVDAQGLEEGNKSQSRNPIIARAFRLLGFAELAGSGMRTLRDAWGQAKRRPPEVMSDRKVNNFTVILDWRPVEEDLDPFWKENLGVSISRREAVLLQSLGMPRLIDEIVSSLSIPSEHVAALLDRLQRQGVVLRDGDTYRIREDLRDLLRQRQQRRNEKGCT